MRDTLRAKRRRDRESKRPPALVLILFAVMLLGAGALVYTIIQHDRVMSLEHQASGVTVPEELTRWNPSWPPLPPMDAQLARPNDVVRAAYAFAARRSDVLQYIPCYCGCERHGHRSNVSCYIKEGAQSATPTWDTHSYHCGLCLDITRDVMQLYAAGAKVSDIRKVIDARYVPQYGAGTPTPRPSSN